MQIKQEKGHYTLYKENEAIGMAVVDGATILRLEIVPEWRGRGYGSYLVKELLRRGGGLDPKQTTRFTAPLPRDEAGRALARRFDFLPEGGRLVRRRVPDLSAVQLCHEFLEAHLTPGGAVSGRDLRQRQRYAVPLQPGRAEWPRAGHGYPAPGRGPHEPPPERGRV